MQQTVKDAAPVLQKAKKDKTIRASSSAVVRKRKEATKKAEKTKNAGQPATVKKLAPGTKKIKRTNSMKQVIKEAKKITRGVAGKKRTA